MTGEHRRDEEDYVTSIREVRLAEDGRVAQMFANFGQDSDGADRWLCMTAPDGVLAAALLTAEEVADWRVIWPSTGAPGRSGTS